MRLYTFKHFKSVRIRIIKSNSKDIYIVRKYDIFIKKYINVLLFPKYLAAKLLSIGNVNKEQISILE